MLSHRSALETLFGADIQPPGEKEGFTIALTVQADE